MRTQLLLIAQLACRPSETDTAAPAPTDTAEAASPTDTADTAGVPDETDTAPEDTGLNGVAPDPAIPLPTFAATNRDGTPRGPEHLTGDPTVIWFFRDAGSAG